MALSTADPLYPINSTTVDTAAGIDIRLLSSAEGGATDSDQSVRWTHTQDGAERTFDPDNALVTTVADSTAFQGEGWALRLSEDMTPTDDTNCNAVLTAQTLTVQVRCLLNMNGGTNLGGNTVITFRASLWRYNVSSNTGTLIASGSQTNTWNTAALGDNNTRKNTSISVTVASNTEFFANEVLFLQLGAQGTTLPNAVLGTTNFDVTLDVDDSGTFLDFAAGGTLAQVCYFEGTASGSATPLGAPSIVLPTTGDSDGISTVTGSLEADKETTGVSDGVATVSGALTAVIETTGTASSVATVSGSLEADKETVGVSAGTSDVLGDLITFAVMAGSASGLASVSGSLEADAEMTGTSSGTSDGSGALTAVIETIGTADGLATVSGVPAIVVPTTGTVNVSEGGGETIVNYVRPTYLFPDD